ncbi:Hypothetical_protein [Hexamita inflata]|uniref:Hypothetical_protein n=1 Tax=Hexamita inflata TaxID=28002 RepID=A0AA86PNZ9_9EUKA|nr:Hypothetical protein HINF_LOCUS29382 [Hexamita inflata]
MQTTYAEIIKCLREENSKLQQINAKQYDLLQQSNLENSRLRQQIEQQQQQLDEYIQIIQQPDRIDDSILDDKKRNSQMMMSIVNTEQSNTNERIEQLNFINEQLQSNLELAYAQVNQKDQELLELQQFFNKRISKLLKEKQEAQLQNSIQITDTKTAVQNDALEYDLIKSTIQTLGLSQSREEPELSRYNPSQNKNAISSLIQDVSVYKRQSEEYRQQNSAMASCLQKSQQYIEQLQRKLTASQSK